MSGTSGSSGYSGPSGTGGIAWGTVKTWGSNTTTMSDSPTWFAISGSSYSHTGATFGIGGSSPVSMLSVKNGSSTLNVNNMKGIDFRKTVRSTRVSAAECI